MSEQSLGNGETCTESDLYIFKGMEGFEESDDAALVALLDDLHEDTLLTLLDDNLFVKDLCEHPFGGENQHNLMSEGNSPLCSSAMYSQNLEVDATSVMNQSLRNGECENRECLSRVKQHREGNKRLRNDNIHEIVPKKVKLDKSAKQSSSALASVMHDHCYASLYEDQHNSNANSDEENSNEEGSSSDTGKDLKSE